MDIGPVEILVVGFPGNQFNGRGRPGARRARRVGVDPGDRPGVRHSRTRRATWWAWSSPTWTSGHGDAFRPTSRSRAGCCPTRTSKISAPTSQPNSSAAILLFEHVWATKFRDAVLDSGGELLASIRIPKDVVDEVLAAS